MYGTEFICYKLQGNNIPVCKYLIRLSFLYCAHNIFCHFDPDRFFILLNQNYTADSFSIEFNKILFYANEHF